MMTTGTTTGAGRRISTGTTAISIPRPDINVDGDVNVNRGRFTSVDRDRVNVDRDQLDIDRDRLGGLGDDAARRARDQGWNPSEQQRTAARDKIARHKTEGGGVNRPDGALGSERRPGGAGVDPDRAAAARDKLKAGSGGGEAREKLQKASAERRPADAGAPAGVGAEAEGEVGARGQEGEGARRGPKAAPRPKAAANQHKASRPQAAKRPAAKHAPKKQSAFKKTGGRPKAASSRGKQSKAKRR